MCQCKWSKFGVGSSGLSACTDSLWTFFLRCTSFCGSHPPILVASGRAHGFLSDLPMTSVSSRNWLSPRASVICSLVSYFPSISGASAGIPWLQHNWQLSESKLINKKKMIMLQRTLHYSFKVFVNIILLIITIAQGKINIVGYLTSVIFWRTFFPLLVIVWLCYEIWVAIFIQAIWI